MRGLVVLYETLVVGTRWLVRSASLAASRRASSSAGARSRSCWPHPGGRHRDLLPAPAVIATFTASQIENGLVQHLVEGLIRVGIFIGYLLLIAQAGDVKRVFQYHGAEHMTIHAWRPATR